jgi:hypothetical protein
MTVTGFQETLPVRFRPKFMGAGISGVFREKTERTGKRQRITGQNRVKPGLCY